MTDTVTVCDLDGLPPGSRRVIEAFGGQIVVFNVAGRLYAVDAVCPHAGGPLSHGRITGARLADTPFEHRWDLEDRILVCPWHGWEFDLETGSTLFDPGVGVAKYEVAVVDGTVLVNG
jgi:3-phenylpropionate/trans-cinnamate dioxygenase ferredoxin subunit